MLKELLDCIIFASAVEEQTATTGEMSRSVGDAAHGATNIAGNISGVAEAAQTTTATLAEPPAGSGRRSAIPGRRR